MRRLNIIHPYGVIDERVPFGSTRANYAELASSIKTYNEQVESPVVTGKILECVRQAQTVVFLGFRYHDPNMALLKPRVEYPASKSIYGTAYGLSDSDVVVTSHEVDAWFKGRDARSYRSDMIKLDNKLKCVGLFENYAKSLTAA
jgi:hypothetical protein